MTIDFCYEDVISKLTSQEKIKDISQKLLSLTTNSERVLYVYDLMKDLKALPNTLDVQKSENVSTYYRNLGNKSFQNKDDYVALQCYNLSLLHSPLNTENYCLALSNRSAVLYSLEKYKECIQDIEEVYTMKYPEKLKDKLDKRKESSEDNVSKINNVSQEETSNMANVRAFRNSRDVRYPCASSKLEVVFSEEMGRHVIAKEDIKVGEVLVQENPYFSLLLKDQFLFACHYCLSRKLNLLPCDKCCFSLYCSKECKEKSWKDYHSVECALMPTLIRLEFTKLELLALRTVIKARNDHSDWNDLFKSIKKAESNLNNEFRGHVKVNNELVFDSKYYASIHTLESNIKLRSVSDIFQKSVTAAVFLHFLKNSTDFLKTDNTDDHQKVVDCVAGTLLLHVMTSPTNMHGLSTNIGSDDGNFVDELSIASAPYAYHSLLNHSCAPNVFRCTELGKAEMTLYALRPIKKGMQLFDNYGSHHALQDRDTRQESLKFQYKFTCQCEACVDNWPHYLSLKPAKNLPQNISKTKDKLLGSDTMEKLQKGDRTAASNLFKPLCELAESLEPFAPCVELADCQEALKQCLIIIQGLVPYGYSKIVEWSALPPEQ